MKRIEDKPLVSVIMPCYNHEKYVAQSIESVLNQTYENVEFIVLDNGSTDGSYEIIKQYNDRIDKIIHFDKNNFTKAGHVMRLHCTGEYIAFMTSDDLWEQNKLEEQMKIFEERPEVKACFTWAYAVDEDLRMPDQKNNVFYGQNNRSRCEWLERLLLVGNCFAYPSTVINKEAYYNVLERLMPLYQISDKHLWVLMLLQHDIYMVEKPLVRFRWHKKGKNSNRSTPNIENIIRDRNENAILLEETIEDMDDDTFIGIFGKDFRDVKLDREKQILCEKFFLLMRLAEKRPAYRQNAINFYYKHSRRSLNQIELRTVLEEEYQYTYLEFQEFCAQSGVGYMEFKLEQMKQQQNVVETQKSHLNIMRELLELDIDKEQRILLYRKLVYLKLSKEQQDFLLFVKENVGNLIKFIDNANDEQILNEMDNLFQFVFEMRDSLKIVWDLILQYDISVLDIEWNEYVTTTNNEEMSIDQFIDYVLPLYVNCYMILEQYTSKNE